MAKLPPNFVRSPAHSVEERWLLAEQRATKAEDEAKLSAEILADLLFWVEPVIARLEEAGAGGAFTVREARAAVRRAQERRVTRLQGITVQKYR